MDPKEVINLIQSGGVFDLTPEHFEGRLMSTAEAEEIFKAFDAFWMYKGEAVAQKPHALLKSGKHSNGFIMCKAVLHYPRICHLFANEVVKLIERSLAERISEVDVIASSAYSAITLGWEVARLLSLKHNPRMEYVIVEKDENGNPTNIRGGIDQDKNVIVLNELMTTGSGSTWETREAVIECNTPEPSPKIFNQSFVLMHRSEDFFLADESPVVPIFHFSIGNYDPEDCPWCKAGSKAIKPKLDNNWNILHGITE